MNILTVGTFPNYRKKEFSDKDISIIDKLFAIIKTSKIRKHKIKAIKKLNEPQYLDGAIVWVG